MNRILCFLLPCLMPFTWTALPHSEEALPIKTETSIASEPIKTEDAMMDVQIIAGDHLLSAKLYDTQTTRAFLEQMPMTITMDEMNGNEKFFYFSDPLPTDSHKPSEIKSGDLMLYGSDCLVLFYENFSTSYSYTRLGYVEDSTALSDILGDGSVQITFQTNKEDSVYVRKL